MRALTAHDTPRRSDATASAARGDSRATKPASRNPCEISLTSSGKKPRSGGGLGAFDELRFGPQRTLNLRERLPSAADAVRRAESWLREQQVHGSKEVLVITGRGNQSPGGIGVIRGAVEKLLFALRRGGVIASHYEHNPGAFVVELAPLRALTEAPRRKRDRRTAPHPHVELHGLARETIVLLRALAERSLNALGVAADEARIADEMHRHLRVIASALPGGERMEDQLRSTLRAAIAEYD